MTAKKIAAVIEGLVDLCDGEYVGFDGKRIGDWDEKGAEAERMVDELKDSEEWSIRICRCGSRSAHCAPSSS